MTDIHVFDSQPKASVPKPRKLMANRYVHAVTVFQVFGVGPVEVICAGGQAIWQIKQVRFAEANTITLHLCTGHCFRPKFLASATPRPAFDEILNAARR